MFDRLFAFVRQGIKNAILGGIEDAQAEIQGRIEDRQPLVIEADHPFSENGKHPAKKKTASTR